ncbi:MAG: Hsp70 family protein [Myxococcales bacterium]|nr:Hsp70 family protein [Myxococcales bacterium]
MTKPAIGIDFGTNFCIAAHQAGERCEWVRDLDGAARHASIVTFLEDDAYLVGNRAQGYLVGSPADAIDQIRRLLGQYHFSPHVALLRRTLGFALAEGPNHEVRVKPRGHVRPVQQVAAIVLSYIRALAERHLGEEIRHAVLTVPLHATVNQRHAMKEAAQIAGFEEIRLLSEPAAAAISFAQVHPEPARIAVVRVGAGGVDCALFYVEQELIQLLGQSGEGVFGGNNLIDRLVRHCLRNVSSLSGVDFSNSRSAYAKMRHQVERALMQLTDHESTEFVVGRISKSKEETRLSITRGDVSNAAEELLARVAWSIEQACAEANLRPDAVDQVIAIGGPTLVPVVHQRIASQFGKRPTNIVDPLFAPAEGAALLASALWEGGEIRPIVVESLPNTVRLATAGGYSVPVIERSTPLPFEQTRVFTSNLDPKNTVTLKLFQGEGRLQKENELLGEYVFSGFENQDQRRVEVGARFRLSPDGLFELVAYDPYSGVEARHSLTLSTRLDRHELLQLTSTEPLYTLSDGSGVFS